MRFLAPTLVLFCACAGSGEPLCRPEKKLVRKAETHHRFLVEAFRCLAYADAYEALSKETKERLDYVAFYSAFASFEAFRGLFLKSERHGEPVRHGLNYLVRICNPDYGFSEEFELRPQLGGAYWGLHIGEEQQNRLRQKALDWWNFQYDAAGDYYVYARDQRTPRMWARCACGQAP